MVRRPLHPAPVTSPAPSPSAPPAGPSAAAGPAPSDPRPIVGRQPELRQLADLLADPRRTVVVVEGAPGTGRSRLLDEAQAWLQAAGTPVRRVAVRRRGTALPDLRGLPARGGPILVLDDVHLLDDAAACALHDLVALGRARVLLSLPIGSRPAEPVAALCKDDGCVRVTVSPLTREACDALVAELAERPVDAATAQRIWALTGGLPRLVVGLLRGLVAAGSLVAEGSADDRTWGWVPPDVLPESFADEFLRERLGGLSPAERDAVDLVACSGPVGPEILLDAGADAVALERLEQAGVLSAGRSGRRLVVGIPDRLLAVAARQRIGRLRRRRLGRDLARAWQSRGCRRGDDVARSAGLLLGAGGTPSVEDAVQGARQAVARGEFRLAERLARSALQAGADTPATQVLAEALTSQGRAPEAESALRDRNGQETGATGPEDAALQLVRASNLRWGLSDRRTSRRLVEEVLRRPCPPRTGTLARLTLGSFDLHDGCFREALALAELVLDGPPPAMRHAYRAHALAISALGLLGRDGEAVERARTALQALGPDPAARPPALPEITRHHFAGAVIRAQLLNGDLDAAEHLADRLYAATADGGLLANATWASLLGEVALLRGRIAAAVRLLDEARTAARRSGVGGVAGRTVRLMATKTLARAHLESGDPQLARRVLADLSPHDLRDLGAIDLWTGDVEAAVVAASHPARGVQALLRGAASLRALRAWGVYVPALHLAVRLGGADLVPAGALDGVTVQGPLLRAQVEHVRSAIAGDAAALLDVGWRYADLGAFPYAAEATAAAARLAEAAGRRPAALRAGSLVREWGGRCDTPLPNVTASLYQPVALTPRQREIAHLAARGLSSRVIAERLVVSVRTVDNYLGQVYRKLGVSRRSELAQVLAPVESEAASRDPHRLRPRTITPAAARSERHSPGEVE